MRDKLILRALFLLLGTIAVPAHTAAMATPKPTHLIRCDFPSMPLVRDSGSVLVLATTGALLPTAGARRVEILDGRSPSGTIASGPAVFVPWSNRSDCSPVPFRASDPPWSPPASPAVYMAVPRERSAWIGGVRTFDVFVAHREPLWHAGTRYYGWSGGTASMTPAEFLTFFAAFPTTREVQEKSPLIERRLSEWESTHRAAAAREPALTMLKALRQVLAASVDR